MNSNPIILKVVIVINFILSGTIYLPFHYPKMSVIPSVIFLNIYIAVTKIVLLKPDEDW